MSVEHRQHARYACDFPCVIQGPRGGLRGRCQNLSVEGAFFLGPHLAVGSSTAVKIELGPLGALEAQAVVRHAGAQGLGLQFTRLEQRHLELLQRLLPTLSAA